VRIQADAANNSLVIFANTEMTQRITKALVLLCHKLAIG
jgi:hypothetical protein